MSTTAVVVGYLVRCRLPREDIQGNMLPFDVPPFRDGFVQRDLTAEDSVFTWVNAFGEPKVVTSQREALWLGWKMARVVVMRLARRSPRDPVFQDDVLDA